VSLTLHPVYRTGYSGERRAMRTPARATEARPTLGRRLAILRPNRRHFTACENEWLLACTAHNLRKLHRHRLSG